MANLVAWPLAWFAMRPWLAAIVVAVLTVGEQAIRVARAEPARALRYE